LRVGVGALVGARPRVRARARARVRASHYLGRAR